MDPVALSRFSDVPRTNRPLPANKAQEANEASEAN
jgi:hypothetical protein